MCEELIVLTLFLQTLSGSLSGRKMVSKLKTHGLRGNGRLLISKHRIGDDERMATLRTRGAANMNEISIDGTFLTSSFEYPPSDQENREAHFKVQAKEEIKMQDVLMKVLTIGTSDKNLVLQRVRLGRH